jgi:uncharacterized membrane protein YfcA
MNLAPGELLALCIAFFAVAALFSSVGHAGASGYLAIMALIGIAPATMRPTALALNILVASIATLRFARAGQIRFAALWPFALGSVPFAAFGGAWKLGDRAYYAVVAAALLAAAAILLWRSRGAPPVRGVEVQLQVSTLPAIGLGAAIGLLAGLTGTGGGIYLSPLVLLAGWAGPLASAGIAAPFILANSTAGLMAGTATWASLPPQLPWLLAAVLLGGLLGTSLGLNRFSARTLFVLLAAVLVVAAVKLAVAP